jgi:hypothetical protein
MRTPTRLSDELFRFTSWDDQLILAVALALTEVQESADHPVIGITADYLWDWLEACIYTKSSHPNIDHKWTTYRAMQQALRRVADRGLLRGTADAVLAGPQLWRPSRRAGEFLAERRLFTE